MWLCSSASLEADFHILAISQLWAVASDELRLLNPWTGGVVLAGVQLTFHPYRYEYGGGWHQTLLPSFCQAAVIIPTGFFFTACCQEAGQPLGKVRDEIGRLGAGGSHAIPVLLPYG